jgi:hypothetical protein
LLPEGDTAISPLIANLIQFYSQPEQHPKQITLSSHSLTHQFFHPQKTHWISNRNTNFFKALFLDSDIDTMTMDVESPDQTLPKQKIIASWTTDAGISKLSDDIFSYLQSKKQFEAELGEIEEDSPCCEKPQKKMTVRLLSTNISDSTLLGTVA